MAERLLRLRQDGEYSLCRLGWHLGRRAAESHDGLTGSHGECRRNDANPTQRRGVLGGLLEPLRRVRTGRLGEEAVTELLRSLSDHYYLVNDVTLGRLGNVDHVLVGPCGVVVIETKRIAGGVRCNGDGWYVRGWPRKSFSRQVNANAVAVKDKLREWYPDQAALALRFVESVIVFTNPLCRLEINQPRAIVVRYSELLDVIRDLARRHQLSVDLAGRFARTLALDSVANGRVSAPR